MVYDLTPSRDHVLRDVLEGLDRPQKEIPCKYLYDRKGSELFDAICEQDEYYLTRSELEIMEKHAAEMASCIGPRALLIEYGIGSGVKTRLLLDRLEAPAGFVPVDISRESLKTLSSDFRKAYPEIPILPVCADFTRPFELPSAPRPYRAKNVYFPGSTIGNFSREGCSDFLKEVRLVCGKNGGLLVGVDIKKNRGTLEAAYNDRGGVTEAFNRNLLERLNRELGSDFEVGNFRHRAVYNEPEGCIEMHLISLKEQTVRLGGKAICFAREETIRTERSYKYDPEEFRDLGEGAGMKRETYWTDGAGRFSVHFFRMNGR